jgi:hypothetical protein
MSDCDITKNNKKTKRKRESINALQGFSANVGTILQSVWVRCRTIFPTSTDRKFMESELRFVLYSGILFWTILVLYQFIK